MKPLSKKERLKSQHKKLLSKRESHKTAWKEQCEQILPYRARWSSSDYGKNNSLASELINSTPRRSLRIFSAGMMASVTSPSRVWYQMTTADSRLNEVHRVKEYLEQSRRLMSQELLKSRWYQSLADGTYQDLGSTANSAMMAEDDGEGNMRYTSLPVGQYCWDVDAKGNVDTNIREFPMTVRQLVEKFGYDNCSPLVRGAHDNGSIEMEFDVVHAIYPNSMWSPQRIDSASKRWSSDWYEKSAPGNTFLRESGYDEFPVLTPRWNVIANETYGLGGPGYEALGDCREVQHLEMQKLGLIDKSVDPPMTGVGVNDGEASLLPGDVTYAKLGGGYQPSVVINPNSIMAVREEIAVTEQRIKEAFFVDMWLAMQNHRQAQPITATEVEQRKTEIMLQLGPLLENLNSGLLDPGLERLYNVMSRNGKLPDPPPEMDGSDIRVEYISILHQAQKVTGLTGIRETLVAASQLAELGKQDAVDKINSDAVMDEVSDILGVRPELIFSDDEVATVRQAKAKQAQAQQQGDAMLQATQGIKNIAGADPGNIQDIAQMVSGPMGAAAQGGGGGEVMQ